MNHPAGDFLGGLCGHNSILPQLCYNQAMNRQPEILEFIKSKSLMTVSSVNTDGSPQSALVGFGETDSFQLIFGTSNTSRKYANLQHNPKVAVVVGWDGPKTVQYEGVARELMGGEADKYAELYFTKSPSARKQKHLEDHRYFLVEPTWVRLTDLSVKPWDIVELTF